MSVKAKVKFIDNGIKKKVNRATKITQEAVSVQVAVDSNQFIPKDTGFLESSVFADSNFQKGQIIWGASYAMFVYYNTSRNMKMHTDKNPQASTLWFEVAKTQYLSDWVRLANNVFKKEL